MILKGSIPSKKNSRNVFRGKLVSNKNYIQFEKSIRLQIRQNYYQWFEIIKKLDKPVCFVLNIYRYRNDKFDWDNKIASVQDALFKWDKKKSDFACLPLEDDYQSLKIYPGKVIIDKDNLKSNTDDWFELILVKEIDEFTILC